MGYLASKNWNSLTFLDISHNKIKDKGCKMLTQALMNNLDHLRMDNCEISNEGLSHLSKADWKQLKKINIQKNKINSRGLSHLVKINSSKLTNLMFQHCVIDEFEFLKANFQNLEAFSGYFIKFKPVIMDIYGQIADFDQRYYRHQSKKKFIQCLWLKKFCKLTRGNLRYK